MARTARKVVPGIPHHIVQRGVRLMSVFLSDADKRNYLRILGEQAHRFGVRIWAYCLMDNHVHLVAVPEAENSFSRAIGQTHCRYTREINFREGWRGHLWQGRFYSALLDESYLYAAIRYVEQNPVKAGLVLKAEDYPWSSAKAHVSGSPDPILSRCFLTEQIEDWSSFLAV